MNGDPYSNIIDGEKERRVVGTETVTEPEYGYYEVQQQQKNKQVK